jgi:hypothetical protein
MTLLDQLTRAHPQSEAPAPMNETDVEFLERMKLHLVWTAPDETLVADIRRLFSLARRGAKVSAEAPSPWRPIETAPEKALWWVLWDAEYDRPVVTQQRSADGVFWAGDWDWPIEATHWMPLPHPPAEPTP